jgi:hypothetical protein
MPLVWTPLESVLLSWLLTSPFPPMHFQTLQILVGAVSGALLVAPLTLFMRRVSLSCGLLFVIVFLLAVVASTYLFGGAKYIPATLALPDLWVFLLVALGCFWWAAKRKVGANAT